MSRNHKSRCAFVFKINLLKTSLGLLFYKSNPTRHIWSPGQSLQSLTALLLWGKQIAARKCTGSENVSSVTAHITHNTSSGVYRIVTWTMNMLNNEHIHHHTSVLFISMRFFLALLRQSWQSYQTEKFSFCNLCFSRNSYSFVLSHSHSQPPGLFSLAWAGGDSDDPEVTIHLFNSNNRHLLKQLKVKSLFFWNHFQRANRKLRCWHCEANL